MRDSEVFAEFPCRIDPVVSKPGPPHNVFNGQLAETNAMQPLLGPVIDTWNSGQGDEACQTKGHLIIESGLLCRIPVAQVFLDVVVVKERDKEPSSIPMRAYDGSLIILLRTGGTY